jgi:lipopolysaccharide transport protein LptA
MLMANMYSNLLVALILLAMTAAHAQDYGLQADMPINIDADSSDFNYTTNRLTFTGLRVTQGTMSIAADYAETDKLDFDDGLWIFNGNVRVESDLSVLSCDNARLTFKNHQLAHAEMTGQPANFQQTDPQSGNINEGQGKLMIYDLQAGTVTLSDEAAFSDGTNRMSGSSITYNVVSRRISANSGESGSVRILIDPTSSEIKQLTD